jgi:diguanylate cyclase (GGDEF)-like protein
VALAFVGIDHFKSLNTALGHNVVDLHVLPVFMRAMEAFIFVRGFAYRLGGDEYGVLFGNGRGALGACKELRENIARLRYHEVLQTVTVSVGIAIAQPDCELADQAILERANRAMRYAKEQGRNCIGTYSSAGYGDEHLMLWPTVEMSSTA